MARLKFIGAFIALPSLAFGREPWIVIETEGQEQLDPRMAMVMASEVEQLIEGMGGFERPPMSRRSPAPLRTAGAVGSGGKASAALAASATSVASPRKSQAPPSVARSLGALDNEESELRGDLHEMAMSRQRLEDASSTARSDATGGVRLRRTMAKKRAEVAATDVKLHQVQEQIDRLRKENAQSLNMLRSIEIRRLNTEAARVKQQQDKLAKFHTEAERWNSARDKLKVAAVQTFRERTTAVSEYKAAVEAEEKAKRTEEAAELHMRRVREEAAKEVEAVKAADIKAKAAKQAEERQMAKEKREEASLAHMRQVFQDEETRLNAALSSGVDRLSKKIKKVQKAKEDATSRWKAANKEFASWKKRHAAEAQAAISAAKDFQAKQEAAIAERSDRTANLQAAIAKQAVAENNIDSSDWAWSEEGDAVAST